LRIAVRPHVGGTSSAWPARRLAAALSTALRPSRCEGPQIVVRGSGDENKPPRRGDRATQARHTRAEPEGKGGYITCRSERHLPAHLAGGQLDRYQGPPGRWRAGGSKRRD